MRISLNEEKYKSRIRITAAYLALLVVILYIITGFGITQYQIVEKLTLGLLSKPLSFKIHSYLIYPFILFLAIHLYFSCDILNRLKRK